MSTKSGEIIQEEGPIHGYSTEIYGDTPSHPLSLNLSSDKDVRYFNSLFTINWLPSVDGFFSFIEKYRKIINVELGGSRQSKYKYTDPTVANVLSVGTNDDPSSLPQRISLTNFNIGFPITSYGCIYRYSGKDEPEYLLIRRCDSVSYVDLIRGSFRESQLFLMIGDLPEDERKRLISYDFNTLWCDFHRRLPEGDAYDYAYKIFQKFSPYFQKLFDIIPSNDPDGKYFWLFPKGRPNYISDNENKLICESPFETALREFKEETNGYNLDEGDLLLSDPVVERFLGSNSKNYQTIYFIFKTDKKIEPQQLDVISTEIREISVGEVSEIRWVPLSQINKYLRLERQKLIYYIEEKLLDRDHGLPIRLNPIWKSPLETNNISIENEY